MVKLKSRYVLLEILSESADRLSITPSKLFSTVAEKIGEFHGDYGFAASRSGLMVKVVDGDVAVIRFDVAADKFLKSILPFITNIDGTEVVLRSLFVGRSIRACEKFLIKYRRNELYGMLRHAETGVEKKMVLKALNDVSGKLCG
ncbi:hypothetical protein KIN20_008414 [Parelaphostrongylus tenuis]|uniref:Ribonuclease P/MRP protein subunit POP5 n=1 Tax=Parelaphostrongylus tenuis TaxID=148309 RepID=A0AAD5M800_PARTN|nr:hypothetical protein KIN20_008414 [Parelaphostrongylus tenuis]